MRRRAGDGITPSWLGKVGSREEPWGWDGRNAHLVRVLRPRFSSRPPHATVPTNPK